MVDVKFRLPSIHLDILQSTVKYKVIAAGRRFGKTQLIVPHIYKHLSKTFHNIRTGDKLNHSIGYYAPTYKQAEEIFWQRAVEGLKEYIKKVNGTLLRITFLNGGTLQLFGTEVNPDTLRGSYRTLVIRDEAAHQPDDVYTTILSPMLADVQGELLDISTPNGFNLFHDHFQIGQSGDKDWKSWQYESHEGGYITEEYQLSQRKYCGMEEYRQEWCAQFVGKSGRVYYAFSRKNNVTKVNVQVIPLYWSFDFNEVPHCHSVLGHVLGKGADSTFFIFDEICVGITPNILDEFMNRYSVTQFPEINICGDSFGNKSTTGLTDYDLIVDTLRRNGYGPINLLVKNSNPTIRNRTNLTNRYLCSADDRVRILVDENCSILINDLEKVERSPITGKIDKTKDPRLSHASDALGYMVDSVVPLINVNNF